MENSLISSILKRDGDKEIAIDKLYNEHDKINRSAMEKRVLSYLDNDMVNIKFFCNYSHIKFIYCY
uniref:Uncharacterized protein n=1 Tax=Arundo donax TaxID=35708 RepID=A0A0A9HQ08_ARUDO